MQARSSPRIKSALTKRKPPQRRNGARGGLVYLVQDAAVFEGPEAGAETNMVLLADYAAQRAERAGAEQVAVGVTPVAVTAAGALFVGLRGADSLAVQAADAGSRAPARHGAAGLLVGATGAASRATQRAGAALGALGVALVARRPDNRLGAELVAIGASAVAVTAAAARYLGLLGAELVQGTTPFPGGGTGHIWRLMRRITMGALPETVRREALALRDDRDEFDVREHESALTERAPGDELAPRVRLVRLARHEHQDELVVPVRKIIAHRRQSNQIEPAQPNKLQAPRRSPKGTIQ